MKTKKKMQIRHRLLSIILGVPMVLFLLTGCPKQKNTDEEAHDIAKKEAVKTSIKLIQLIKDRDYDAIKKMHIGGVIIHTIQFKDTSKEVNLYKSNENFKWEVDFISKKLQGLNNINNSKIEVLDENEQGSKQVSQLECVYQAFKTDSEQLSIRVVFLDLTGPKEIAFFKKDYTNFKSSIEDSPVHNYKHIIDSLKRIKDSLDVIQN